MQHDHPGAREQQRSPWTKEFLENMAAVDAKLQAIGKCEGALVRVGWDTPLHSFDTGLLITEGSMLLILLYEV